MEFDTRILFHIVGLLVLLLFIISYFLPNHKGSARFGTARFTKKKLAKINNKGIVVDGLRSLSLKQSYEHFIACGPTGGGKSQKIILPTLFKFLQNGSIICTDPKSELTTLAASVLKNQGVEVQIIDFGNPQLSLKYNPLERLETEKDFKNFALALVLLSNPGAKDKMDIWLMGACGIIATFLATIKNHPDPSFRTMASLIWLLNFCEDGSKKVHDFIQKYAPNEVEKNRFHAFSKQEYKIKKGILASAMSCLTPFDNEQVKQLTQSDDLDFSQFRKKRMVLFIKMPVAGGSDFTPVVSLFYEQLLRYLLGKSPSDNDLPLLLLLEEFGNLPIIKSFSSCISLARSFKISIAMVVQNLTQIDNRYKSEADTILANAGTLLLLPGVVDEKTLNHAVKMCGTMSYGVEGKEKTSQRNLLNADEIKNLKSSEALLLVGNNYPQKINTFPFYKQKKLLTKLGIQSVNNRLVPPKEELQDSKLESPPPLPIPSFEDEKSQGDSLSLKDRLKNLLNDELEIGGDG